MILGTIVLCLYIAVYMAPAITAYIRKKKNLMPIFLLNLLLGWTILGWVLALVWACMVEK